MVERKYQVVWTKKSQQHLKQAFDYVSKDSVHNAIKVLKDIAAAVNKAINNPEFYGSDKYKINNDGSYRLLKNIAIEYLIVLQKISSGFYRFVIQA